MRFKTKLIIVSVLILLGSGCANAGTVKYKFLTNLSMIKEEEIQEKLYLGVLKEQLQHSSLDENQEKKIAFECGITLFEVEKSPIASSPLSLVPPLNIVAHIGKWVWDKLDKEFQEHLEKYSAVYEAKVTPPTFYKQTGVPKLQSKCFRFSRYKSGRDTEQKKPVVVDLIVQMQLTKDHDALQIRPLRLYQSEAIAKSDDKSYGIAASIRMNAVWLQENRGMSEEAFNHTFLEEKITFSQGKPVFKYFLNDKKWEDYPVLPLPPWSTNVDSSSPAGNVEVIISMAESGKPSELLKFFAKLFRGERNNLPELLKRAAESGLH